MGSSIISVLVSSHSFSRFDSLTTVQNYCCLPAWWVLFGSTVLLLAGVAATASLVEVSAEIFDDLV